MFDIQVQVTGADTLAGKLLGIPEAVRGRLRVALARGGNDVKYAAIGNIHRRSGDLGKSILTSLTDHPGSIVEKIGPSQDGFYGRFIELGLRTSRKPARRVGSRRAYGSISMKHPFNIPAQPFLRPAIASLRDQINADIRQAVADGLKESK